MGTIAKLLIEINGDTSGLTAALDKSTASVRAFAQSTAIGGAKNLTAEVTGATAATAGLTAAIDRSTKSVLTLNQAASHVSSSFRPGFQSVFKEEVDGNLKAAEAATHHSISLGRVAKSFEGVIVEGTGLNEQLSLLTAAFGHLEFGEVAMIGALGAIFMLVKG
jgi:hypothetical protein